MHTTKELRFLAEMTHTVANIGIGNIAYIKKIPNNKGTGYGLFAADGKQLAVFASRDAAYFTARQHDLEPVSLH